MITKPAAVAIKNNSAIRTEALYKTKDVVELLAYIELQKKIDQQVVDKKIEDQI